jgi:excisionase family DNA binding protein
MNRVEKLLTPQEVADVLGVKVQTLSVWRSHGRYDLPYIKSGSLVRYREADVLAFIENRRRETWGEDMKSGQRGDAK